MKPSWDIFCSVVDNYGDIGVCWRLARQLAAEHAYAVRLWIDDLMPFARLCPAVDDRQASQEVAGVDVRRWDTPLATVEPADVVVEGFGARLPESYVLAMAERQRRPVWVNLEYLTAESWIEGCHGLPSPHPRLPLTKFFFFPGFTARTGGVLMERSLHQTRDAFQADAAAIAQFWAAFDLPEPMNETVRVSLFCYENAALPALVAAWSRSPLKVVCVVPEGRAATQLSRIVGQTVAAGARIEHGRLTIAGIEFLELDRYDRLLWACDLNFVRGEDSFVRAQLAARPLVWQAYPQAEGAHHLKVRAFLERYARTLSQPERALYSAFTEAWNAESGETGRHWEPWLLQRAAFCTHARSWAARLGSGGNLAAKLAEFAANRLK